MSPGRCPVMGRSTNWLFLWWRCCYLLVEFRSHLWSKEMNLEKCESNSKVVWIKLWSHISHHLRLGWFRVQLCSTLWKRFVEVLIIKPIFIGPTAILIYLGLIFGLLPLILSPIDQLLGNNVRAGFLLIAAPLQLNAEQIWKKNLWILKLFENPQKNAQKK